MNSRARGRVLEVRIYDDHPSGPWLTDFAALLPIIEPAARNLQWTLLEVDGRGDLGLDESTTGFSGRVQSSEPSIRFTWPEVRDLLLRFEQIDWLCLLGAPDARVMDRKYPDLWAQCDLGIECEDGSWWAIHTRAPALVGRAAAAFRWVKAIGILPTALRETGDERLDEPEAALQIARELSGRVTIGQLTSEDAIEALSYLSFRTEWASAATSFPRALEVNLLWAELRRIEREPDAATQAALVAGWQERARSELVTFARR